MTVLVLDARAATAGVLVLRSATVAVTSVVIGSPDTTLTLVAVAVIGSVPTSIWVCDVRRIGTGQDSSWTASVPRSRPSRSADSTPVNSSGMW